MSICFPVGPRWPSAGYTTTIINYDSFSAYEDNIDTTRKILQNAGIQLSSIEKEDEILPHLIKHSSEWIGPTILFTATTNAPLNYSMNLTWNTRIFLCLFGFFNYNF